MIGIIILGILIVLVVLVFIGYYNRIVVLENRIDNAGSQIDVQLKKRADLVPNLINTVKGYAKHEKELLENITKARSAMVNAQNLEEKAKAGNELQRVLKSLFAVAENYPQLRANENFLHLQHELSGIEDKVAYARQHYNDAVLSFNNIVEKFPSNIVAGMMKKNEKKYLEIPAAEREVPKVSF
ncbi:MAG TPA: LemA family protein [Candidatus Woesearchaeota archaeon]|nr:LemA family protein [Candidatus Woesearchaeota archaeon]